MASAVGSILTIIQLVDTGLKARDYIQDFRRAPLEQQKLLSEMDDLRPLLHELHDQIVANPSRSILQQMGSPLAAFQITMEQFTAELRAGDGPFAKFSKRLTWTMWNKKEAIEYLAKFEQFKSLLNSWLLLDIRDLKERDRVSLTSIIDLQQQTITNMDEHMNSVERAKIIDWLSPLNFFLRHADISSVRQQGTGEWLLDDFRFREWVSDTGRTLWCHGIPGAGKTVLASKVVDYLSAHSQQEKIGVACVYLNHKEAEAQPPAKLLAGIWRQLVLGRDITSHVKQLYHRHLEKGTNPSFNEIEDILCCAVGEFSRVYIVVDAVDEYPDDKRQVLLKCLAMMDPPVHLMITSRPHITPNFCFPSIRTLEIRARKEDIQIYVDAHIQLSTRLSKHLYGRPDLRQEIHRKIGGTVDGMFLLAKLHVDSLTTKPSVKAIREALNKLPKDLRETYESAMKRIKGQTEEDVKIARSVLTWVVHAKRPLTVSELRVALAIEPGAEQFDGENVLDIEVILSVCAGLVVVDEQLSVVRLVHYTAQEYFDSVRKSEFPEAQTEITRNLLTFLAVYDRSFKSWPYFTESLFDYCEFCLPHAVGEPEGELREMIIRFLSWAVQRRQTLRKRWRFSPPWDFPNWPAQPSALWIAAASDLSDIARALIDDGPAPGNCDNTANSALQVASYYGHSAMIRLLLDHGANPNVQVGLYGGALQAAAYRGHQDAVCLLIEGGADVNALGGMFGSALQAASSMGDEDIVDILFKNGADVNALGGWYNTPLQAASFKGHTKTVQSLLEKGADVNAVGGHHGGALVAASFSGHAPIVQLLLDHGAHIDAHCGKIGSALQAASSSGQVHIVRLLLVNHAAVNGEPSSLGTALQAAMARCHYNIVQVLIENGAQKTHEFREICTSNVRKYAKFLG
ncbi:ANK-REP-REGION domain-containing protein [Mycena venus]|uniref:ANK-REP-REGION domain-containing protein n=1 Tax=Mycena venus TaxID=2733690 RepID=A0A8H6YA10_9AGAR|nr:ANK-REP-REGION domain-containing protein [Mycena venus]